MENSVLFPSFLLRRVPRNLLRGEGDGVLRSFSEAGEQASENFAGYLTASLRGASFPSEKCENMVQFLHEKTLER